MNFAVIINVYSDDVNSSNKQLLILITPDEHYRTFKVKPELSSRE